jgi:hypothetical protein
MDTRIDFNTAKKFDQLDLVDWKTRYGDFKVLMRSSIMLAKILQRVQIMVNISTHLLRPAWELR